MFSFNDGKLLMMLTGCICLSMSHEFTAGLTGILLIFLSFDIKEPEEKP